VSWLVGLLFVLHVGGAIIGFGPSFAFPFIGSMGGAEPMHSNFAIRLTERIEDRLILPLALLQGVTGVALIWLLPFNVFAHFWLLIAIAIYVMALAVVFLNQIPATRQLVHATSAPPPSPAPGAPAPDGPPPHIAAMIRRAQLGGMILTGLLITIIILMVLGTNGFLG
jgi:Predicted integral membrane protein (DUF2269)